MKGNHRESPQYSVAGRPARIPPRSPARRRRGTRRSHLRHRRRRRAVGRPRPGRRRRRPLLVQHSQRIPQTDLSAARHGRGAAGALRLHHRPDVVVVDRPGTLFVLIGWMLRPDRKTASRMGPVMRLSRYRGMWMQVGGHACMGLVLLAFEVAAIKGPYWGQATFSVFVIAPYVLGCVFLT